MIVAEDITSRFFNVLTLIAASLMPIIALQVAALKVGPYITLRFTKVLDVVGFGPEEPEAAVPKGLEDVPKGSRGILEACFDLLREILPNPEPNYRQDAIGVILRGLPSNRVLFRPRRAFVLTKAFVSDRDVWVRKLQEADLESSRGGEFDSSVRFRVRMPDISTHGDLLKELFTVAFQDQG